MPTGCSSSNRHRKNVSRGLHGGGSCSEGLPAFSGWLMTACKALNLQMQVSTLTAWQAGFHQDYVMCLMRKHIVDKDYSLFAELVTHLQLYITYVGCRSGML